MLRCAGLWVSLYGCRQLSLRVNDCSCEEAPDRDVEPFQSAPSTKLVSTRTSRAVLHAVRQLIASNNTHTLLNVSHPLCHRSQRPRLQKPARTLLVHLSAIFRATSNRGQRFVAHILSCFPQHVTRFNLITGQLAHQCLLPCVAKRKGSATLCAFVNKLVVLLFALLPCFRRLSSSAPHTSTTIRLQV